MGTELPLDHIILSLMELLNGCSQMNPISTLIFDSNKMELMFKPIANIYREQII